MVIMMAGALRRGELVEVKSPAEILATLDARSTTQALPFMPEMLQFCGQRFVVDSRADRICDTMHFSGTLEMPDTVLLSDLRCDGSGHGGCQADCRIFWKEGWLRRVEPQDPTPAPAADTQTALRRVAEQNATFAPTPSTAPETGPRYQCQATEHFRASRRLRVWDPRAYLAAYAIGNVKLGRFVRVMVRALVWQPLYKLGLKPRLPLKGSQSPGHPKADLGLQPGDLVRVKPAAAIGATLTPESSHNGFFIDYENLPHCDRTFRVHRRVTRQIDEHTGYMLEFKDAFVTLEQCVCSGDYSIGRWFCPRHFYVQWSEAWLERVGGRLQDSSQPHK
jgi:hypothetical protein